MLKNNSDGKGNSYGTHENYLMDRAVPFARIVQSRDAALRVPPDLHRRRQGRERGVVRAASEVDFQLTQRADFFEEEVGLETTLKRPIVNTRDEPHCDAQKYRRLHVIVGDANMSEVANFLKVGTTALVLAMIEDDWFARADREFTLATPGAGHAPGVLRPRPDPAARVWPTGGTMTALEMQWEHLDLARKYAEDRGLDAVGGEEIGREILRRWEQVLTGLESDPMTLAKQLDWVAKYRIINGYRERQASTGRTPSWPPWTCSTTTCDPSDRCTPGSGWSGCSTPRRSSGP